MNPYTAESIKGRRKTLRPIEMAMNTYQTVGKRSFKINIKDESFPPSQNPSNLIETGHNTISDRDRGEICPTCKRASPENDSSIFGSIIIPTSDEISPAVI